MHVVPGGEWNLVMHGPDGTDYPNKTLLTWHMLFESAEKFREVVKKHGAAEGLKQNGERLETYLKARTLGNYADVKTAIGTPVSLAATGGLKIFPLKCTA